MSTEIQLVVGEPRLQPMKSFTVPEKNYEQHY